MKSALGIAMAEHWVRSGQAASTAREIAMALLVALGMIVWMVVRDICNERKQMGLG